MARTAYDPSELPRPMALASVGLLMKTLPLAKVQQALREEGKESQRERQLPAQFLVYLVVSLSLYMPSALREVLRIVLEGLRTWEEVTGGGTIRIATKGAISRARTRLGWEVLKRLFESVAQPQATPRTRGAWYRKWRLMVIDGTSLALQYTEENVKEFGLPDSKHGPGAFPLLRLVALVEVGTRVVTRTAFAPWRTGEMTLAQQVVKGLTSGLLLLEDRGYVGYAWWKEVAETGADILCRVRGNMRFPRLQELPDGSFLSVLKPPQGDPGEPVTVRVIEYGLQGLPNADARYRVITTILDPEAAPARELAALYHERWEVEILLDEFKTHLRGGSHVLLRSKTPDLVRQEVYGLLLAHYTVRTVMHEAALQAEEDPDRLSFLHTVRVLRRKLPLATAFPPSPTEAVVPKRAGGSAGRTGQLQPRPQRSPGGASTH